MGTTKGLTLVLDPEGHDLGTLCSTLLSRGQIVATRRDAFECLSYVVRHRPALVLIRPTRLPGEAERIADTVQKLSRETRAIVLAKEEGSGLQGTIERIIEGAARDRLAGA